MIIACFPQKLRDSMFRNGLSHWQWQLLEFQNRHIANWDGMLKLYAENK
jgi:hypothetical protein